MFYVALLSHVTYDEFNEMSMFDVRRFAVEREIFLRKIYNSSHPCPDNIQEDASLYGSDKGVTYNLDDVINNDSDSEDTKKRFII